MTALAHWSPQLSALTADVAVAIGPWLSTLDTVLTPDDEAAADLGEPDGFDGLTTRGTPDHILLSEWLLASEEPDEFLRRATTGELLHVARAYRRAETRARVLVLIDGGPAQWGAPRLAQMAAILVLHGQAERRGVRLGLGHVTETPGTWFDGALDETLAAWQQFRHLAAAGPAELAAWRKTLGTDDEVWLLTCTDIEVPGMRTVTVVESGWSAAGVSELTVTSGGRRAVLPMPPVEAALKTARGNGFRPTIATSGHAIRFPMFPNDSRWLLGRGPADNSVIAVPLPTGRVRTHEFGGSVAAAGMYGRRLIVLYANRRGLNAGVIGRDLKWLWDAHWQIPDLPSRDALAEGPLRPLYTDEDHLIVNLGDHWLRLRPDEAPEPIDLIAAGFGRPLRLAWRSGYPAEHVLFGTPTEPLWSADGRTWTSQDGDIEVPEHDEVIGTTLVGSASVLITRSPGGQILRMCGAEGVRTLTRWSSSAGAPAVHPAMPWLALPQPDGSLTVADISTDTIVHRMRVPG
jgi:hypothetical protein